MQTTFYPKEIYIPALFRAAFFGWLTGLAIALFFVFAVDEPKPEWGTDWFWQPIILTPIAVGLGATAFFLLRNQYRNGTSRIVATVAGSVVLLCSIWFGSITGLAGTLWN